MYGDYAKNGFLSIVLFYIIGDLITTYYALSYGYENNDFLASMIYGIGFYTLIVGKIVFLLLLIIVYEKNLKNNVYAWGITKYFIISVGIFLTLNNTFVIVFGFDLMF